MARRAHRQDKGLTIGNDGNQERVSDTDQGEEVGTVREHELDTVDLLANKDTESSEQLVFKKPWDQKKAPTVTTSPNETNLLPLSAFEKIGPPRLSSRLGGLSSLGVKHHLELSVEIVVGVLLVDSVKSMLSLFKSTLGNVPVKQRMLQSALERKSREQRKALTIWAIQEQRTFHRR